MRKISLLIVVMLVSSVAMADLAGYWPFDDPNSLSVADASGNGNGGLLYAADSSNYPQWIAGHDGVGGALEFNAGTTGSANCNHVVVDIASTDPLANLGESFTIAMWVRRDALGSAFGQGWPRLVHTNAYDVELALNPDSTATSSWDPHDIFWADLGGLWQIKLGTETADQKILGNWYHIAVTCDAAVIKRYINGVEVYAAPVPEPYNLQATTDLRFGAASDGGSYLTGALDDLAIWTDRYLPAAEVAKLANGTATPLTVVDEGPYVSPYPNDYFAKETNMAWNANGWKALYNPSFSTRTYWPGDDITVNADNTATAWWVKDTDLAGWPTATMIPGGHYALWGSLPSWEFKLLTDADYYATPSRDVDGHGIAWIDPTWSGVDPNVAKFAAYITPDIAICTGVDSFQPYNPTYSWEMKDYFKTYARVAAVNGDGVSLRVKSYSYLSGADLTDPNSLTLLGDVSWPLTADDYVWEELKYAYPKPTDGSPGVWVEVSFTGGSASTIVYIDEFNPVSDQANTSFHNASYYAGDTNEDAIVNNEDLLAQAVSWLETGSVNEPGDTAMLTNGDFYVDAGLLDPADIYAWASVEPTGWTFAGIGDAGIQRVGTRGSVNYSASVDLPLGGSVATYIIDDAVLEQTTTETLVAGQTYYAMAYVIAKDWNAWKDMATVTLEVDGVDVASFARPLSRLAWRPIYGAYTAIAADAGKQMTIKISYDNTHVSESPDSEYMFVGYTYLGDSVPAEWPEGRSNVIANGGFEDLTGLPQPLVDSLNSSDNWGAWLVDDHPAPAGWIYEVPAAFNEANQGGFWASGYYGTPLPTDGMNDVTVYTSDALVLGQVIGSLAPGQNYYLDMACGVLNSDYGTIPWPAVAPAMHIELYQIPAGVTDGPTINAAIASANVNYVKVAEAYADATGNIVGGTGVPAAKWQMIGTQYTATAADTDMYVRVYGVGGAGAEFAFSDVYLSTEKRLVSGGSSAVDIAAGMLYDVAGPYTCQHAAAMGLNPPQGDVNGDCHVDMVDFAVLAGNWLDDWYTNITGTEPWE